MDDPHDEAAASRTDLAEDRTILANERTFAGWMRTSLACVALGVGFHALFQKLQPPWVPKAIATAFLILAIIVIIAAERRASAVMSRLSAHVIQTARTVNLRLFAAVISLCAAALIAAIWLLRLR
jgi:putative membrane protein